MALIDAEHITDAVLIEKYMGGTAPSASDSPLTRVAGVKEIFQSIAQSIWQAAASLYDPQNPIKSIINFTATGALTIFGPWWAGLIYFIASEFFGLDFATIFDKIKDYLVNLLSSKKNLSARDVKSAVSQALGGASANDHVVAHDYSSEVVFKKMARVYDIYRDAMMQAAVIEKAGGVTDLLLGPVKLLIKKVVAPPMAKSFLGKVLSFIFKSFLIGTSKAMAGKAGRDLVGGTGPGGAQSPGGGWLTNMLTNPGSGSSGTAKNWQHKMKPTSFGTTNEPGNWEEEFAVSNIANSIADWATQRYPALAQHKGEMMQTESFKNVVKAIQANNSRNHYPDLTYIPHQILGTTVNSKAEIVDLFAGEIAQKLGL